MSRRAYTDDPSELTTSSVLTKHIPWETYLTARLVSDRDLQLIRRYDKATRETQLELIKEAGPAYVEAFLSVLRTVTKEETVQYVLALLDNMLSEHVASGDIFHKDSPVHGPKNSTELYSTFQKLLQRTDWFTQEKACCLLAAILSARPYKGQPVVANGSMNGDEGSTSKAHAKVETINSVLTSFVDWLCSQLRRPSNPARSVPVAVSALASLLKERATRSQVLRAGGVQLLAPLLRSGGAASHSQQLLYETTLCIWQLSFLQAAAEAMATGVVPGLVETARTAAKEKVVRVALLALKNLLSTPGLDVGPDMVEAGLPKVVSQRQLQNWEDEDVPAVLEALQEKLDESIQLLSSFDKYKREVLAGSLDWTPMHTSDQFWRENAAKFEDKDFQVLRVLLKLLESGRDARTLAVGCSDIGYFIYFHPIGRQIVSDMRGKELVMRLMMHPDPEVQKQALLCVQKIMLARDKLEFFNAQSD